LLAFLSAIHPDYPFPYNNPSLVTTKEPEMWTVFSRARSLVTTVRRGLANDAGSASGGDAAVFREGLYGVEPEMTYGGALSFLRRKYSRDLSQPGVDLVVSGVPFDNAVTYRPGARLGPRGIRAASVQLAELKPFPWGENPFDDFGVIDYGDCFLVPHRPETIIADIEAHATRILASGAKMLTFGGDHFVTYPLLRAHAARYGAPLSLIHFDAHCDTWPEELDYDPQAPPPVRIDHGSMFYRAVKEGLVDPRRSVQIGLRTWNDDYLGFHILDAPTVHRIGVAQVLDTLRHLFSQPTARGQPVYLTFDIDCLDPAFAPGTGTPVPGGLTSAQCLEIIRALGRDPLLSHIRLVGADVVEVSPPFDVSELTSLAAAHIACDLLNVFRQHKLFAARQH
jgi:agmatinase